MTNVKFGVFTVAKIYIIFFWAVTPWSLIGGYYRYIRTYLFYLQGSGYVVQHLEKEASCIFKILVTIRETVTRCHNYKLKLLKF